MKVHLLIDTIYKVVVTGANGFIGKNLLEKLKLQNDIQIEEIVRSDDEKSLTEKLDGVAVLIHLAGVNRPDNPIEFEKVNFDFTQLLLDLTTKNLKPCKFIFSSSKQATLDNAYGKSKLNAEILIEQWVAKTLNEAVVFRLPGVFGKYCKPFYNSVVATFCHNIAHNKPINIHNPEQVIELVYIDDVIHYLMHELYKKLKPSTFTFAEVTPIHHIKLGQLASIITRFHDNRNISNESNITSSFEQSLHTTYKSYLN